MNLLNIYKSSIRAEQILGFIGGLTVMLLIIIVGIGGAILLR